MKPCEHDTRRMAINQWDDADICRRCNDWVRIYKNVRGRNPNFPKGK